MYLEGSILFSVGAAFSMQEGLLAKGKSFERALVAGPYFAGGICFTIGSYLGLLEALHANCSSSEPLHWLCCSRRLWRLLKRSHEFVTWKAIAGYGSYTVGALFFNVNTVAGFSASTAFVETWFVWIPAICGSVGFVVGSILECHTNRVWHFKPMSCAWVLSIANLFGSVAFLLSGITGLLGPGPELTFWLVDFMYLLGSLSFMVGALCTLWLWKCEQYGLGFMPELNLGERSREPAEAVLSMHEEYGCGRASGWQLPFLTMYLVNATASVILVGFAEQPTDVKDTERAHELFEAVLNFSLSHGVMLLGSVVHHIPTARPHSWLLIYMRFVLTLYTVNSWINVLRRISI
jgi:hypothetical protein